jgi:DNA-binding transcriptional LysR family regulator
VACPTSIGRVHLLPRIGAFLSRYPDINIDLQISDRFVDMVEEGVEVAIRIGALRDSSLRARRVGVSERVCVASPSYLSRRGRPRVPADLATHDCVMYTLLSSGNQWAFLDEEVTVNGRFRVNAPDGIYRAVLDGLGIGLGPLWLFEQEIRDGRVQILLHDHIGPAAPINIVYSAKRLLPRRASVFMDFVADEFAKIASMNEGALKAILVT